MKIQRHWLGFLIAQLALLSTIAAWAGWRATYDRAQRALPELRSTPRSISPLYDEPLVVSDDQLRAALLKLRPRWDETLPAESPESPGEASANETTEVDVDSSDPIEQVADSSTLQPTARRTPPKLNHLDHALRFWTLDARFDDRQFISGEDLRRVLADHRGFAQVYSDRQPPLLIDVPTGVRVRVGEGPASSSHVDHTMACLAEVGTPIDFPLVTPRRSTVYRDLVEQSLRDFSLNQTEYEWSALTYALLLASNRWQTSEGQNISFDRLAERIMREPWPKGVCFGNHRLYGLVAFLRIDDQWRDEGRELITAETRARVVDHLTKATRTLIEHQNAAGLWNADWPTEVAGESPTSREGDRLSDRILSTGHALEWWAVAPAELQPPREVVIRAGQWLAQAINELDDRQVVECYTYLSHAGRALALWRGLASPADAFRSN